jgi:hypothetical protein
MKNDETLIHVLLGKSGIIRAYSEVQGIANGKESAECFDAASLGLNLVHKSLREHFSGTKGAVETQPVTNDVGVWLETNVDGEFDSPRKIEIEVGVLPRDPFNAPPSWFVEGCRKLFANEDWTNAGAMIPKDVLLSFHTEEYIAKYQHLSEGELNTLADPPYCTRTEEMAISLFGSRMSDILDHWGWVGECDDMDALVSEPYAVDLNDLYKLVALCNEVGWNCVIKGLSGHHPGKTIRIEIKPKG